MSVCFFVPADQAGSSTAVEENEESIVEENSAETAEQNLQKFWAKVHDDIKKVSGDDFKTQALPLARIKKIMKLDEEVKMVSAEAPMLFAKAAEIFIHELTLRAWSHTEDNKRRTLQRNDITMAISKSDQFDFLIDIVPRYEIKPTKPRDQSPPRPSPSLDHQYIQQSGQQQVVHAPQQYIVQPCAQLVQQQTSGSASSSNAVVSQPQPVAMVQQIVSSTGEVQNVPLQLTQAQINMIRLQVQNNPGQPIIIQTQQPATQTPQIIQVTSQGQPQPQQMYLAQISQDESLGS